ncbi:hypothetical protein E2C01_044286 [Portunus trituberculatus]|uniref:Uncharacterized protein n=1 Tax=Portunus trituberculatus TaxID=210409 RepID=A0A5B7FYF5_PORTR|nr:hypothetical protein [Portunus trituberculatus]
MLVIAVASHVFAYLRSLSFTRPCSPSPPRAQVFPGQVTDVPRRSHASQRLSLVLTRILACLGTGDLKICSNGGNR